METNINLKKIGEEQRISVLIIAVIAILYSIQIVSIASHPYEDAAILMRYSQNLAQTGQIVWNVGEHPVDGATDFLFMIFVAALIKLGIQVEIGVQLLGTLSHLATITIVYTIVRRFHAASNNVALISAAYLLLAPGMEYVRVGFGTTFFSFIAIVAWYYTNIIAYCRTTSWTLFAFSISTLILGLARPEGVLLGFFMLASLSILLYDTPRCLKKVVSWYLVVNVFLGGAYFLWRWNYFGHPLPNPFYVKGGGQLHYSGLVTAIKAGINYCAPFIPFFMMACRSRRLTRECMFGLTPVVLFLCSWVLLSDEMNYLDRFQYPILPIVLTIWPLGIKGIVEDLHLPATASLSIRVQRALSATLVVASIGLLVWARGNYLRWSGRDGRYEVATMLAEYRDKQYTIATPEAGNLPLYSRWKAVDVYGLNDSFVAHNRGITAAYLDSKNPEVIMFPMSERRSMDHYFIAQTIIKSYVSSHDYILAAAFGNSLKYLHCYYVRKDFQDSANIVKIIKQSKYFMYGSSQQAEDFASSMDLLAISR